MENEERIIKKTSGGWKAILGKQRGSLILTNRRLIIGDSNNSIPLEDIIDVDIETRLADVTQIQIECKDGTKYLEFVRRGGNHVTQILLGDSGWSFSEVSSYTSYWASILTMAIFLFGQAGEMRDEKYEDKKAWCHNCKKYVNVPWTDTPIWKLSCPECGHKPLTSLSPKDRL